MRGVAFALKPKVRVGLLVFKHVLPQVVASKPKGSGLRRSASLAELDLSFSPPPPSTVAFNFLTPGAHQMEPPSPLIS